MSTATRIIEHATREVARGADPADAFFAAVARVSSSMGSQERAFSIWCAMVRQAEEGIAQAA